MNERRVGRHEQDVRVVHQLEGFKWALGEWQDLKGEVQLTAFDQRQEVVAGDLGQPDLDVRPGGAEIAHEARQDARAHALVRADPQDAQGALAEGVEVGMRSLYAGQDRVGVGEQQAPSFGEVDAGLAARAFDQALADQILEGRDLLGHGGLGVAKLSGGAAEGAGVGDGLESDEVAQLETAPDISVHTDLHHKHLFDL